MRRLLKYLKNYKKELILGPFFKLLEAVFELIVPVVMAKIIDNGIGMDEYEKEMVLDITREIAWSRLRRGMIDEFIIDWIGLNQIVK